MGNGRSRRHAHTPTNRQSKQTETDSEHVRSVYGHTGSVGSRKGLQGIRESTRGLPSAWIGRHARTRVTSYRSGWLRARRHFDSSVARIRMFALLARAHTYITCVYTCTIHNAQRSRSLGQSTRYPAANPVSGALDSLDQHRMRRRAAVVKYVKTKKGIKSAAKYVQRR